MKALFFFFFRIKKLGRGKRVFSKQIVDILQFFICLCYEFFYISFLSLSVHINSIYLKVVVSLLGNRLTKRGSLVELLEEKERGWSKRLAWLVEKLARPGLDRAHWRSVRSSLDLVPILRHRSSRRVHLSASKVNR